MDGLNSKLDKIKERITQLKIDLKKLPDSIEINDKKQMFRDMENGIENLKFLLEGVSERQNQGEPIFGEIMAQIFPELIKHKSI